LDENWNKLSDFIVFNSLYINLFVDDLFYIMKFSRDPGFKVGDSKKQLFSWVRNRQYTNWLKLNVFVLEIVTKIKKGLQVLRLQGFIIYKSTRERT
jgi:hypothetical protein